jgi:hypothetical protein
VNQHSIDAVPTTARRRWPNGRAVRRATDSSRRKASITRIGIVPKAARANTSSPGGTRSAAILMRTTMTVKTSVDASLSTTPVVDDDTMETLPGRPF